MKFLIRADASEKIGTGHVMRCLALGQSIMDSDCCDVVFVVACENEGLVKRLIKEGFRIHVLTEPCGREQSLNIIRQENPDWIVLDGYHFDSGYREEMRKAGNKMLVIDDYAHLEWYDADIILNQDYGAERFIYKTGHPTKILRGTEYVFLRHEFLKFINFDREIAETGGKLLVTMGGADAENNTLKVLRALVNIDIPLNVRIIVGVSNPHYESLKEASVKSRHNIELLKAVENMAHLMAWADMAVSAGGTTAWELAFMGLPSLLCITADNQEYCVNALARDGLFRSVGWIKGIAARNISDILLELICDKALRTSLSRKAGAIVDGKGAFRVIKEMKTTELSK